MFKVFVFPVYLLIRLFSNRGYIKSVNDTVKIFPFFYWQKIKRINGRIPWPVHKSSKIVKYKNIKRGTRNPGMNREIYIDARNGVEFGKNVWIGPKVSIISMNHDANEYTKYIKTEPIRIGDNCWIGAGAIILPGVQLGNHVIVGAGAVVTKSFTQNNIAIAGNPAKVIKELGEYGQPNAQS
jgi:acetyltransferase-like isoleucine patch superfamily enzyme